MKLKIMVVLMVALVSLSACTKDKNEEQSTAALETTTEKDFSMDLEESTDKGLPQAIWFDGSEGYTEEAVEIETKPLEEQLETLNNGDIIEKAKEQQDSIESSEAESRAQANETISESQALESQVVTDEMHEEFEQAIDDYNQKEVDEVLEQWKKQNGGQ